MRWRFFMLMVWVVGVPGAWATEPKIVAPPITAAWVLEQHVAATGGREAYAKLQSLVIRASSELAGEQPIRSGVTMFAKRPNRLRMEQVVAGSGDVMVKAYDGKVGWSEDSFSGLRDLGGQELAQLRDDAWFNDLANWRQAYRKTVYQGTRQLDGRSYHLVQLYGTAKAPRTAWFDGQTFVLSRVDSTHQQGENEVHLQTYFLEHKRVEGILFCCRYEQVTPLGRVQTTVYEVLVNRDLPETIFRKPTKPPVPVPLPQPRHPVPHE